MIGKRAVGDAGPCIQHITENKTMKKTAMLFPLMGIELDGASIRFGMTAAEVEDMLGPAENTHNNRRYYFQQHVRKENYIPILRNVQLSETMSRREQH